MTPEAVLRWSSTLAGATDDEMAQLSASLFAEIERAGLQIVSKDSIARAFNPLVVEFREELVNAKEQLSKGEASRYSISDLNAFDDIDDYELPIVAKAYFSQKAIEAELELKETKESLTTTKQEISVLIHRLGRSEAERTELELERKRRTKVVQEKNRQSRKAGAARRNRKTRKHRGRR
jgi:hypothetical protein